METIGWRKWARLVVYLDLLISTVMLAVTLWFLFAAIIGHGPQDADVPFTEELKTWIVFLYAGTASLVGIWAVGTLLWPATDLQTGDHQLKLEKAQAWGRITITILLIGCFTFLLVARGKYVNLAIPLILNRVPLLLIVWKFTNALKQSLQLNPNPGQPQQPPPYHPGSMGNGSAV